MKDQTSLFRAWLLVDEANIVPGSYLTFLHEYKVQCATMSASGEISFSIALELCAIYDESRYTRKRGRNSPRPHVSADVNEKDVPFAAFARAKIFQAFGVFGYYDV